MEIFRLLVGLFFETALLVSSLDLVKLGKIQTSPAMLLPMNWMYFEISFGFALGVISVLLMPLIILGGIYAGVFTPTESAAVAVLYGLLICFFGYKEISLRDVWNIAKDTAISVSNIMMLVATAQVLGYMLTYYRIPNAITEFCLSVFTTKFA